MYQIGLCYTDRYYGSKIGSWKYVFTVLKNINVNWTDSTPQIREWAKLVLLYDIMHFVQQQWKEKEESASQQQWMAYRNQINAHMSTTWRAMEWEDDDFATALHFIIDRISPRLSFFRDNTTDFQFYTRAPTQQELLVIEERNLDSTRRGWGFN